MNYLTDYCATVRRWIDDQGAYDDATITEWIRDAEERMNNELRSVEQIQRDYATFDDNCSLLPPDWAEHIYVRVKGGAPFDYITPHDYWRLEIPATYEIADPYGAEPYPSPAGAKQFYTTIGKTLFVWPPVHEDRLTQVEVCYFRQIVPLGDNKDAVFDRYPSIYRYCTLTSASPYLMEDDRVQQWAALATAAITKANEMASSGRWSGSPLAPRWRSFG